MALTDLACRTAKTQEKPLKLNDERGLMLLVTPKGSKWWRFRYKFQGKGQMLSLGVYPDVSLKEARARRDEARTLIADGVNPSVKRKVEKLERAEANGNSFELWAKQWMEAQTRVWTQRHAERVLRDFERDIFPAIGTRPVSEVEPKELLRVLKQVEERGALVTAKRLRQCCGAVFRFAVAHGVAKYDPSSVLVGALRSARPEHHATITDPAAIGELLRAISAYNGTFVARSALKLAPLVFVRTGELREAQWSEFDLDAAEWRIPAERMKMRAPHIVPLSKQAIAILQELQHFTGKPMPLKPHLPLYLFPSERTRERPMSNNTILAALRRMGYAAGEMTGHGFRSMASTLLNEHGWNRDAIERQLAHGERDKVRAAYNYAEHLPERRRMMQAWADYLDQLSQGTKKVVPLQAA